VNHVVTSTHFEDDLSRLPAADRKRVLTVLRDTLPSESLPPNLNIKAIKGYAPWLRLRVGDWRIIFRPLARGELEAARQRHGRESARGYYVETVVRRSELPRVARRLR
jgi:mRNA-degrading endonuclease RelE of RelBE toxin-antitoxin system